MPGRDARDVLRFAGSIPATPQNFVKVVNEMKVKELLKVMFNDQCVTLIRNGLKSSVLFFGTVSDMPDEFKNFIVTSCFATVIDSGTLFICVDEV